MLNLEVVKQLAVQINNEIKKLVIAEMAQDKNNEKINENKLKDNNDTIDFQDVEKRREKEKRNQRQMNRQQTPGQHLLNLQRRVQGNYNSVRRRYSTTPTPSER